MADERAFDSVFRNAMERCSGVDNFFDRLFGFFSRNTDLFDDELDTLQIIDRTVKKHIKQYKSEMAKENAVT